MRPSLVVKRRKANLHSSRIGIDLPFLARHMHGCVRHCCLSNLDTCIECLRLDAYGIVGDLLQPFRRPQTALAACRYAGLLVGDC